MGPSETAWDQRSKPEFTKEQNGIYYVTLEAQRGASARVSLHGGQVVSWKNERGEELLFTSNKDTVLKSRFVPLGDNILVQKIRARLPSRIQQQ